MISVLNHDEQSFSLGFGYPLHFQLHFYMVGWLPRSDMLTQCGSVMPYTDIDLGLHWSRLLFYQASTGCILWWFTANEVLWHSLIPWKPLRISFRKMNLNSTLVTLLPHLSGINEVSDNCQGRNICTMVNIWMLEIQKNARYETINIPITEKIPQRLLICRMAYRYKSLSVAMVSSFIRCKYFAYGK